MKKFLFAISVAVILSSQVFTPVNAARPDSKLADGCGDAYVVQYRDYLTKIARLCGTSVPYILSLNPQIFNPNLIYPGQVLRLTGNVPINYAYSYNAPQYQPYNPYYQPYYQPYYYPPYTPPYYQPYYPPYGAPSYPPYGYNQVSLSTGQARPGDSVTVYVSGFPANAEIDYRIGKQGDGPSLIYDGSIASNGTSSLTFNVPGAAVLGDSWYVLVLTTEILNGVQSTANFYIIN